MIIVQNAAFIYCKGGTLPARAFDLSDWLQAPVVWVITPQVLIEFLMMCLPAAMLRWTPAGRGFYLLGANPQTAWFSGLHVNRYVVAAFVLSGVLSALGGAVVAISEAVASPTLGDSALMTIVAAVIIGGTSMDGGKGSLVGTGAALVALAALINGLHCRKEGYEVELMAGGLVLVLVILYDAYSLRRRQMRRGQRKDLLAEVPSLLAREEATPDKDEQPEGVPNMDHKDRNFALVCVTVVGCVAIVAIFAMHLNSARSPGVLMAPGGAAGQAGEPGRSGPPTRPADVTALKSTDGQPLLIVDDSPLVPPARPANPEALPEEDALRWYKLEYAGWQCQKEKMPSAPGTGARGKRVICLRHMDHPYTTAYTRGMQMVADFYGIQLETLTAGNADVNIQSRQVDQVINERPDLAILFPVDAESAVPMLRKLYKAGIPVIASNLIPVDEGMRYVLTWTGPDDWGQFRMLAREFARRMNNKGSYCIIQHMPGGSPFFSRTYAVVTELKKIAPEMKLLEKQTTMLEAEKTMQVVSDWITKYGPELKGIVSADDSGAQTGINEAVAKANREDIIRVAAGNSKVGMDFIRKGKLHAITYQSAEADGALPMKLAADWFNGKEITRPVYYLPKHVITKDDVDQYLPAQW
jgi:ribose transport system substrate-binding protein